MSLETEFHTELELRACEHFQLKGYNPISNFRLPNGRIADLIFMPTKEMIVICEVKTILSQSLVMTSLEKYRPYCNHFWIAAPSDHIIKEKPFIKSLNLPSRTSDIGLLAIKTRSTEVIQYPSFYKLRLEVIEYMRHKIAHRLNFIDNDVSNPA